MSKMWGRWRICCNFVILTYFLYLYTKDEVTHCLYFNYFFIHHLFWKTYYLKIRCWLVHLHQNNIFTICINVSICFEGRLMSQETYYYSFFKYLGTVLRQERSYWTSTKNISAYPSPWRKWTFSLCPVSVQEQWRIGDSSHSVVNASWSAKRQPKKSDRSVGFDSPQDSPAPLLDDVIIFKIHFVYCFVCYLYYVTVIIVFQKKNNLIWFDLTEIFQLDRPRVDTPVVRQPSNHEVLVWRLA